MDTRDDLPKVHYATALDWFVNMCFGFVIASLLQFAAVHFFTKIGSGDFEDSGLDLAAAANDGPRSSDDDDKSDDRVEVDFDQNDDSIVDDDDEEGWRDEGGWMTEDGRAWTKQQQQQPCSGGTGWKLYERKYIDDQVLLCFSNNGDLRLLSACI